MSDACSEAFAVLPARGLAWLYPGQGRGFSSVDFASFPLFAFPFRAGVETIWLNAEQLPMLMVPELRRIAILLDAIPDGADVVIPISNSSNPVRFSHVELRTLDNVLVLKLLPSGRSNLPYDESPTFHLPMDAIRSVWKKADDQWVIVVEGEVRETGRGEPSICRHGRRSNPSARRCSSRRVRRWARYLFAAPAHEVKLLDCGAVLVIASPRSLDPSAPEDEEALARLNDYLLAHPRAGVLM